MSTSPQQKGIRNYAARKLTEIKMSCNPKRNRYMDGLYGLPDIPDFRDQELYKVQCDVVKRFIHQKGEVKVNEIVREYPEIRGKIDSILSTLGINDEVETFERGPLTWARPVSEEEKQRRATRRRELVTRWGDETMTIKRVCKTWG